MRLPIAFAAAVLSLASTAMAQTWGQPHGRSEGTTYGQPYGPARAYAPPITEWDTRAYSATGRAATGYGGSSAYGYGASSDGRFGDPYAYRPPVRYGRYGSDHRGYDRGYGRSPYGEWTRWSGPPGRGYHDVYGYNDDRAPRGGAYVYDR